MPLRRAIGRVMSSGMSNFSALTERVAAKRAELQQARRALELLEVELGVWESALSLVTGSNQPYAPPPKIPRSGVGFTDKNLFDPSVVATSSKRGMNSTWKEIASKVTELHPDAFNLDQLSEAAELGGHKIPRATLRSQMANYAKVGLVERVSVGVFRLTDAGRTAAGVLSVKKIDPPGADALAGLTESD